MPMWKRPFRSVWHPLKSREESSGEDIEVKLKKLNSLYEQRLITASEFETKRKELLDKF